MSFSNEKATSYEKNEPVAKRTVELRLDESGNSIDDNEDADIRHDLQDRQQVRTPVKYNDYATVAKYIEPSSYTGTIQFANCQD
jgi:hypothetical protein